MKIENVELWQRISNYSPDAPGAQLPFSARLAKENGWTPEFTARAIEEYKRFVLTLADKVANAHREGGKSVSDAERAAIEEITASLAGANP